MLRQASRSTCRRAVALIAAADLAVFLAGAGVFAFSGAGSSSAFAKLTRELGPCPVDPHADALRVDGPNERGDVSDDSTASGAYRSAIGTVRLNNTTYGTPLEAMAAHFPHKQSWSFSTFLNEHHKNFGFALDFADSQEQRLNKLWVSVPDGISTTAGVLLLRPMLWRGLAAGQRVVGYNENCRSVVVIDRSATTETWRVTVTSMPGSSHTFGDLRLTVTFSAQQPPYNQIRVEADGSPFGYELHATVTATDFVQPQIGQR